MRDNSASKRRVLSTYTSKTYQLSHYPVQLQA